MEMFVFSCVNVLCMDPELSSSRFHQDSEPTWQTSVLYLYTVLLIYVNEIIYLLGKLPVFKIYVTRFMARDDSAAANVMSKYVL